MDPKEFPWDESQQVTVTNPTDKDYFFKVHGKDYVVKSGQTAKMPGFMAWNYVYGLASQLCQEDKLFSRWNEEGFRKDYYERLFRGADEIVQEVVSEPSVEDATDLGVDDLPETGSKRGRVTKSHDSK